MSRKFYDVSLELHDVIANVSLGQAMIRVTDRSDESDTMLVTPDYFFDIFENGCQFRAYYLKDGEEYLGIIGDNNLSPYTPETVIDFYTGLALTLDPDSKRILAITGQRLMQGSWCIDTVAAPEQLIEETVYDENDDIKVG